MFALLFLLPVEPLHPRAAAALSAIVRPREPSMPLPAKPPPANPAHDAPGPAEGVQAAAGGGPQRLYSGTWYSDDGGQTWWRDVPAEPVYNAGRTRRFFGDSPQSC